MLGQVQEKPQSWLNAMFNIFFLLNKEQLAFCLHLYEMNHMVLET